MISQPPRPQLRLRRPAAYTIIYHLRDSPRFCSVFCRGLGIALEKIQHHFSRASGLNFFARVIRLSFYKFYP
ncbi:hypothetical protein LMH87_005519 [Akanthomyces muscarius]|uniref:Uncharacterized protein n=1 Tax=Akanthomyces muscarius TaxID=2231603 RepID=A0A9W8QLI3_AKAMU|nr:hypothetical protein LMH87_005519 [Akanthomyces muscarius]KAJ4163814.1 hypothetical protein LMH87_005519 [Akanthomyces muscarius]